MKKIVFLSAFLFLSGGMMAQVKNLGGPLSWRLKMGFNKQLPFETMPSFDLAAVRAEDAIRDAAKDSPWRFGYKHVVSLSPENSGVWQTVPNGRLWQLGIASAGAKTINLLIDSFDLPEGAYLYLYDTDGTNRVGAYTAANNRQDGLLGTELVHGDAIVVEYFEPNAVAGQGSFRITDVVHGYRSLQLIQDVLEKALNSSGDCNIDVHCPLGNGWENQIRAVAMIVVNGSGICTGALINNSCNDGTPYFLTANHCLGGSTGSWAFRFNWASPPGTEDCATTANSVDPGPPYDQTANGATTLVNGTQADYALLQIDNLGIAEAQAWDLFFAGWNNDDTDGLISQVTGIHHPSADLMKICRDDDGPYHNTVSGAEVWYIDQWEQGVTEPGSSGSPLFDQNGRIIGQLYGGAAACAGVVNNGTYDYFGRLGVSWGLGIGAYLDPASCGGTNVTNDGWNPNGAALSDNASIQAVTNPVGLLCTDGFNPNVRLRNAGGNDLTSCVIHYNVDGSGGGTYNWTGLLAPFASEIVQLPWTTAGAGTHVLNAYTSLPNGVTDSDPLNDANASNFEVQLGGFETTISVLTDCWGNETAWELFDAGSNLIAAGGNPLVPPGGQQVSAAGDPGSYADQTTNNTKLCLSEGCYDFTIYDDWGDGMYGLTTWGCYANGSYEITNSSGTILASMVDPEFGVSETSNFCVLDDTGLSEESLFGLQLYPNPADQTLILLLDKTGEFNVQVNDMSGRILMETVVFESMSSMDVRSLASGNYFLSVSNTSGTKETRKFVKR